MDNKKYYAYVFNDLKEKKKKSKIVNDFSSFKKEVYEVSDNYFKDKNLRFKSFSDEKEAEKWIILTKHLFESVNINKSNADLKIQLDEDYIKSNDLYNLMLPIYKKLKKIEEKTKIFIYVKDEKLNKKQILAKVTQTLRLSSNVFKTKKAQMENEKVYDLVTKIQKLINKKVKYLYFNFSWKSDK